MVSASAVFLTVLSVSFILLTRVCNFLATLGTARDVLSSLIPMFAIALVIVFSSVTLCVIFFVDTALSTLSFPRSIRPPVVFLSSVRLRRSTAIGVALAMLPKFPTATISIERWRR